ncbi:unnamed protein product [Medioppia subpectinata]|uniref:Protein Abitram n=1 Tax=Medioppia subpectinata TaxID=1979941 RepID=A0A7R9PUQ2_9ACAR|nr:unnamed protein product [Medioppia subpectinata]CAG2101014.1 unnamed protein product [Medioppia subpectinata]
MGTYPSVCERYYERKYFNDPSKPGSDQTVLFHSNRVCLITLSHNHLIIKDNKSIENIDFNINSDLNRLDNKVSGKWKKGGQRVNPGSILCRIQCADNEIFDIKACINGTIVEMNTKLIDDYDLVKRKTWSDGFIAIVLPFRGQQESEKESLLSPQQYQTLIQTNH